MGCPVGIGPEIIIRLVAETEDFGRFVPIVVGDISRLGRCAAELGIPLDIVSWHPGNPVDPGKLQVIEPEGGEGYSLEAESLHWGKPGRETGRAAAAYITKAVQLINDGVLDAVVTCPISKYAMQMAGYEFPGHTEMLAELCDVKNYGMMMAGRSLRVSLVTIHVPLSRVPGLLSQAEIKRIIDLTGETLVRDFGVLKPRLAVAGLNPHSGEEGMFGEEESRIIEPAVLEAASDRWEIEGPLPPDTVYKKALDGSYDAVVAMYHDQGLIPFKLVHFEDGVNLTMGLPIIRTSVDHGTAYDIAGKGIARASSLKASFAMAAGIISNRRNLPQRPVSK
ncbi:MAG: 4-hydroxythreonine-4-phosphate dehydrogenase PdxA [Deltaproteobacteria bacterium]|nr:4-hydroxythreonine-4-phosphate dehydrogenase PdxA [Deltaproteobacteria bacterium]